MAALSPTQLARCLAALLLSLFACDPFQSKPLVCDGELVDPQTDPGNCGACGVACSGTNGVAEGRCAAGACEVLSCAVRPSEDGEIVFADENGLASDGCEVQRTECGGRAVDLASDLHNCGSCERSCLESPQRPQYTRVDGVACVAAECVAVECIRGPVDDDGYCQDPGADCQGPETCSGRDDDCDGEVDECAYDDLSLLDDFCSEGVCPTPRCAPGYVDQDEDTRNGCECRIEGPEVCNGADDDCDGRVDEQLPEQRCGQGICARTVPACNEGVPVQCIPDSPADEVCNRQDDDCDGFVDEGQHIATCGAGICLRTTPTCIDGEPVECTPGTPVNEACNGLDDDCDGTIDEGLGRLRCGVGGCLREVAACIAGVSSECVPGPASDEVCNGRDDDCNGLADDLPPQTCGQGRCLTEVDACANGEPKACVPAAAAAPEQCNGIDDNCDGVGDLEAGACPGCRIGREPITLTEFPVGTTAEYDVAANNGRVLVAWRRDQRTVEAIGCDPLAGVIEPLLARPTEGPWRGAPQLVRDGDGVMHVLFEEEHTPSRELETRRVWDVRLGDGGFEPPIAAHDRFVCGAQAVFPTAPPPTAGSPLELVGLADDCLDPAPVESALRYARLTPMGWRTGVDHNLGISGARICAVGRNRGNLVVVTVATAREEQDAADRRIVFSLRDGLGQWRALRVDSRPAVRDANGCPFLVPSDDGLAILDLENVNSLGGAVPTTTRFDVNAGDANPEAVLISPEENNRGVYVDGSMLVIKDGVLWTAAWQERNRDGVRAVVAQSGRAVQVVACEPQAFPMVLVGGRQPRLLWTRRGDQGVGLSVATYGVASPNCTGTALVRPTPEFARFDSFRVLDDALYFVGRRANQVGVLYRADGAVGPTRLSEAIAAGVQPFDIVRGALGRDHVVYTVTDGNTLRLDYRVIDAE